MHAIYNLNCSDKKYVKCQGVKIKRGWLQVCNNSSVIIIILVVMFSVLSSLPCQFLGIPHVPVCGYMLPGAYEPPKAARSVQLRIIAQNGICIYGSM